MLSASSNLNPPSKKPSRATDGQQRSQKAHRSRSLPTKSASMEAQLSLTRTYWACIIGNFHEQLQEIPTLNDVRRWACSTWKTVFRVSMFAMNDGNFSSNFHLGRWLNTFYLENVYGRNTRHNSNGGAQQHMLVGRRDHVWIRLHPFESVVLEKLQDGW